MPGKTVYCKGAIRIDLTGAKNRQLMYSSGGSRKAPKYSRSPPFTDSLTLIVRVKLPCGLVNFPARRINRCRKFCNSSKIQSGARFSVVFRSDAFAPICNSRLRLCDITAAPATGFSDCAILLYPVLRPPFNYLMIPKPLFYAPDGQIINPNLPKCHHFL